MIADLTYILTEICNDSLDPPEGWGDYIQTIRSGRVNNGRPYYIGCEHPQYAWLLNRIVRGIGARRVLELGVQQGGSTYGLVCDLPPDALFVGVDNEADVNAFGGMGDFRRHFPADNRVYVIGEAAAAIRVIPGHWDLVHFDHFKQCYLPDLDLLRQRRQVSCVTVCIFHDSKSYAADYMAEIRTRFEFHREVNVPDGALICWGLRDN